MQSWIFSIITPVFRVTWSFRNHANMLIYSSKAFLIIISVENSCVASYFCGNLDTLSFKLKKKKQWILLFSKDALNWSKETVNTCIMLQEYTVFLIKQMQPYILITITRSCYHYSHTCLLTPNMSVFRVWQVLPDVLRSSSVLLPHLQRQHEEGCERALRLLQWLLSAHIHRWGRPVQALSQELSPVLGRRQRAVPQL